MALACAAGLRELCLALKEQAPPEEAGHVERQERLRLDALLGRFFALRVRGDSMVEDQICDGDYVIVEQRTTPRNGETVVALLEDGEATLKRFYRHPKGVRLQPANPAYEPIITKNVQIQGVVVGVLRKY